MRKKEKWVLVALITAYFISRSINFLSLPIFNDEAIYLHWAQIMAETSEKFYSVAFDGKQPLGMWFFDLAMAVIKDPLVAGRAVSVFFGFVTLLGMYFLGRELGGFKAAIIAAVLYICIPYALFFDRMALMESMVNSAAIWSVYLTQKILSKPKPSKAVLLGVVLGLGFWLKSTALTFIFLSSVFILWNYFKKKNKVYLNSFLISLVTAFLVILPLLIQPSFFLIFKKNEEFLMPLSQLASFPVMSWLDNILRLVGIFSGYVSPFFLPILFLGVFLLAREKKKGWVFISLWSTLAVFLLILTSKNLDTRYLLFVVPGLLVFCSLILIRYPVLLFFLIFPSVMLSVILLNSPASFFAVFPNLANFSTDRYQYITGWPSGYGVRESVNFITGEARKGNALVGVRQDSGNPEDAVWIYLYRNPQVKVMYFLRDDNFWRQLKIISGEVPVYFVSRDNQLLDHENFMTEVARFVKPEGKSYTSVQKVW